MHINSKEERDVAIDIILQHNNNLNKEFLLELDYDKLDKVFLDELTFDARKSQKLEVPSRELKLPKEAFVDYNKEPKKNIQDSNLNVKNSKSKSNNEITNFSAFELYNFKLKELPKLVNPYFQKVGLAALVGTSDSGKSTFLRQLALAISLKQEKFLNFSLNAEHHKVIYVSTEDDYRSVSYSIRKQVNHLKNENDLDIKLLKNLEFIFETDGLFQNLESKLNNDKYDLIIIDTFTDVFGEEINSNTQVRKFLNEYDQLAKKNECLIIFLHHIGKRTDKSKPSKDSIIGSQGFEAKMRSVIELRPNINDVKQKDLWVLKANFLDISYKKKSFVLDFDENLIFTSTGIRGTGNSGKTNNKEVIEKVISYYSEGLSTRAIEKEMKGTAYAVSKSTIAKIIKEN